MTIRSINRPAATVEDVKAFWEAAPLFVGESREITGTREWFLEHERVYIDDCLAGSPSDIFTCDIDKGTCVLDVGCGPGFWVRHFARCGFTNIEACDLTEAAVDLTARSLEIFGLSARVRIGNAERLPYGDASVGHVNCQGVIHHTPDPALAIGEFRRVLGPAGTLCFSVYHKNFLLRHPALLRLVVAILGRRVGLRGRGRESMLVDADANEVVRRYDGQENPLGKAYTVRELRAMLSGLFAIERIEYFFFPARALPVPIPRCLHRWLSRRFGLLVVIKAKRLAGEA